VSAQLSMRALLCCVQIRCAFTVFCTAAICGYVCSVIEVLLPSLAALMLGTDRCVCVCVVVWRAF
jgi:hypothetical protein